MVLVLPPHQVTEQQLVRKRYKAKRKVFAVDRILLACVLMHTLPGLIIYLRISYPLQLINLH